MASGMCKNCQRWSSGDDVWGCCVRIKSDYPNGDPQCRAAINLDTYDGSAELWTRHDFGCAEWSSLRKALAKLKSNTGEAT